MFGEQEGALVVVVSTFEKVRKYYYREILL